MHSPRLAQPPTGHHGTESHASLPTLQESSPHLQQMLKIVRCFEAQGIHGDLLQGYAQAVQAVEKAVACLEGKQL